MVMKTQTVSSLKNTQVVAFESREQEQIKKRLLSLGAFPVIAPAMQEIPLEKSPERDSFIEKFFAGQIDLLILNTGTGTRLLLDALLTNSDKKEVMHVFEKAMVIARGPKPANVLRAFGLACFSEVSEPSTWKQIIETLDVDAKGIDLAGRKVAIQEAGQPSLELLEALRKRGAHVMRIPLYRLALPDDAGPLCHAMKLILNQEVSVVFFTNAYQIKNLFQLAEEQGLQQSLKIALSQTLVASIGPRVSASLRESGLPADYESSRPTIDCLVDEVAQWFTKLQEEKSRSSFITRAFEKKEVSLEDKKKRHESVFLKACRREPVPYTPVWLMRQAGRYMESYRRIRSKVPFLELCKTPELAAEVTVSAAEALNTDAAILFSDLLLIVEPMGLALEYTAQDGPMISGCLPTKESISRLNVSDPADSLSFVYEAVRLMRASLKPEIPLIGFSGAPFTMASYILEGGASRLFLQTKTLMYRQPETWHLLMDKIVTVLVPYLKHQIQAGADAVQIFDSWVGCLSPEDFRNFVLPHSRRLIQEVGNEVPVIHFGTGTAPFLRDFREAGGDVIGIDYRISLDQAWNLVGHDVAVQGNLDPTVLCADQNYMFQRAKEVLDLAGSRPGHIFNLGHGLLPQTPEKNVIALVDYIHQVSFRSSSKS